jgi:hypothetical protein
MMAADGKHDDASKREGRQPEAPALAAIGLEAEFALVVDGQPRKVEEIFRDPRDFIDGALVHRRGTSYHLPGGGIVYFDTGVIEVATPLIEIERGCGTRAARSLWESILVVRNGLAQWEQRTGRRAALTGFSAHYNISFDDAGGEPPPAENPALRDRGLNGRRPARGVLARTSDRGTPAQRRGLDDLALLLAYILPAPVMLLATNRASTGVGVRPRATRIEVTVDFTPNASLMVATATLITGIVRAVMRWPSFDLDELAARRLPVIDGYAPVPHTSRKGWLARYDSYPQNPFTTDVDARAWNVSHAYRDDASGTAVLSLREIARRMFQYFRWPIARVADPLTLRLIGAVLSGRASSLLELPERPAAYEDVGRLCMWDRSGGAATGRSRYERVLITALSGAPLRLGRHVLTPLGTHGWFRIVFRREPGGRRQTMTLDALLPHLEAWERGIEE